MSGHGGSNYNCVSCSSCGASWEEGEVSHGCEECGGFGITRPCPICDGYCGSVWRRGVEMSWNHHMAYWDGECKLPPKEQMRLIARQSEASVDDLVDGLEDAMK
eukprot:m.79682 g.79682  ORF g.79682 m.79682 type:complete len:104 (+) comp11985_c0_seq3:989-1300(+)